MAEQPLRLEWLDPDTMSANPLNWRGHPASQMGALKDVMGEVGWAGALLYNERTGRLIDGHARKELFAGKGEPVPVLVGSWTEEQERAILATLDPLGAMAEAHVDSFAKLREVVEAESPDLTDALSAVAGEFQALPLPSLPLASWTPNLEPETAAPSVTSADMDRGRQGLDARISGRRALSPVTCPQCACEFYVDSEEVGK